jgi:hypothetical protein
MGTRGPGCGLAVDADQQVDAVVSLPSAHLHGGSLNRAIFGLLARFAGSGLVAAEAGIYGGVPARGASPGKDMVWSRHRETRSTNTFRALQRPEPPSGRS